MATNIYENIRDEIIKKLEEGYIPWIKPWGSSGEAKNWLTGKEYQGINRLLTEPGKEYATFLQIKQAGGTVKAGSKSKMIVYYSPTIAVNLKEVVEENENTGELKVIEDGKRATAHKSAILKKYSVFEIGKDTEGLELKHQCIKTPSFNPVDKAEEVIANYHNKPMILESGGNRAYWRPSADLVQMPTRNAFKNEAAFYHTVFHELIHSTGSSNRLNRDMKGFFGSEKYAKEELVADIGAAFLMAYCNMEIQLENTVAYCQGWSKKLKEEKPTLIMQAAAQADKAVDYILGREQEFIVEKSKNGKSSSKSEPINNCLLEGGSYER